MESGTLVRWNEDKGFGFIQPDTEPVIDVFIHISTLKHMARKPQVGDNIEFQREQQADGKLKARRAHITGVAIMATASKLNHQNHSSSQHDSQMSHHFNSHRSSHNSKEAFSVARGGRYTPPKSKLSGNIITVLLLITLGIYGYSKFNHTRNNDTDISEPVPAQIEWQSNANSHSNNAVIAPQPRFQCEAGKTHCSHMRTCEEATFYLKNCPTTQMDGDGDGIPCERQHCSW
ncbi:excalibur calcium-binding domain-containing protein [Shewanella sp. SR44-3]|nr:excalibur calcium-binding domain-containing protein [Shewanella sp. SR44-3]